MPLAVVPLLRRSTRRKLAWPATPQEATAAQAASIAALALLECYFWLAGSLWGFMAVMEGGPITFAYVGAAVSLAGLAYSFPRWSTVTARADALESPRSAQSATPL